MKIQELPERQRKIILWSVLAILGIILFFWWGKNALGSLQDISLPNLEEKIPKELFLQFQELEYGATE